MTSVAWESEQVGGWRGLTGLSGVAVAVVIGCFTLLYFTADALVRSSEAVERTYRIQAAAARMMQGLTDAETAQRGYFLTRRSEYLAPYAEGRRLAVAALEEIETLVAEKPDQEFRARELRPWVETKILELDDTLRLEREQGIGAALRLVMTGAGIEAMTRIRSGIAALKEHEARLHAMRERQSRTASLALFGGTAAGGAALAWLVWVVVSRLEREVEREVEHGRSLERTAEEQRVAREEREWLLQELNHRVKNSLQQIAGILRLQQHAASADGAREALADALRRVMAIARVHERLYEGDRHGIIDAGEVVSDLCEELSRNAGCRIDCSVAPARMPIASGIPLMLIAGELLANACRHGRRPGGRSRIRVSLEEQGTAWTLSVADSGPGLVAGAPDGLGTTLVRRLARQLDARLERDSTPEGLTVRLVIPREAA